MTLLRVRIGQLGAIFGIAWAAIGFATSDYDTILAALLGLGSANVLLALEIIERLPTRAERAVLRAEHRHPEADSSP